MAISITNLLEEADTAGGDPVTTAGSVTTVAGRLYVGSVECSLNVACSSLTLPGTITMSGTGLGSVTRGSLFTITFFWGICSVGGTGTVTADFAGATSGTTIIIDEVTGAHASAPIVASSFVSANGGSATTATVNMNAFASASNAGYFCGGINGNVTMTPEAGWTELGQGSYATPTRQTMSQWALGGSDLSPSSTFAASQWGCAAFEIAVAAGVTSETPIPGGATAGGVSPTVRAAVGQGGGPAAGVEPTVRATVSQGGGLAAGASPTTAAVVPQGGALAGAAGPTASVAVGQGGAVAGGVAPTDGTTTIETPTPGGGLAGGVAPSARVSVTAGGALAGGVSATTRVTVAQGGATASGQSPGTSSPITAGGALAGGVSPLVKVTLVPGGATAGGFPPGAQATPGTATLTIRAATMTMTVTPIPPGTVRLMVTANGVATLAVGVS